MLIPIHRLCLPAWLGFACMMLAFAVADQHAHLSIAVDDGQLRQRWDHDVGIPQLKTKLVDLANCCFSRDLL